MQLGTRWSVGAEAPSRLPADVVAAVVEVEASLVGIDTGQWRWTLTFLEGRPVVELDDGTTIRKHADGRVSVHNADDVDEDD